MGNLKEIRPKIWYDYMEWLAKKVHFNKKSYYKLLKQLHDTEFKWSKEVPMDENRAEDGTYQRGYFFEEELGLPYTTEFPYGCSVLEMLVGLALRMGCEYLGGSDDGSDGYDYIFEMFLKNLGLFPGIEYDEFDRNLLYFMERHYKNDGNGSLFRLKKKENGYNKMEIWKQMNLFLYQFDLSNVDEIREFL